MKVVPKLEHTRTTHIGKLAHKVGNWYPNSEIRHELVPESTNLHASCEIIIGPSTQINKPSPEGGNLYPH